MQRFQTPHNKRLSGIVYLCKRIQREKTLCHYVAEEKSAAATLRHYRDKSQAWRKMAQRITHKGVVARRRYAHFVRGKIPAAPKVANSRTRRYLTAMSLAIRPVLCTFKILYVTPRGWDAPQY